jgi:branched-chain amino acid transport system substrate-binding protein
MTKKPWSRMSHLTAAGALLVGTLGLVACGSTSPTSSSSKSANAPIQVAAIDTLTGASNWTGWQLGAKAYFDAVNRQGGINGRKIDFSILDDAGSPAEDLQLATKEVEAGVVGFAGSISNDDCAVNGSYYDKAGIVSIDVGSDPTCFTNPNIAPVNAGPETDAENQMVYAAEDLHDTRICAMTLAIPGEAADASGAIAGFEKITGLKITKWVSNYPVNGNMAPAVLDFKNAKCQAVSLSINPAEAVPMMKDAVADGIHDITWVSGLALYDPAFVTAAGAAANGMYIGLEFAPSTVPAAAQMLADFKADNLPFSQEEESSWTAAWVFGHVLATIKGTVSRATVLAAFRTIAPFAVPTMGDDFTFGTAKTHHPNVAAFWEKIANGQYVQLSKNEHFFSLPTSSASS